MSTTEEQVIVTFLNRPFSVPTIIQSYSIHVEYYRHFSKIMPKNTFQIKQRLLEPVVEFDETCTWSDDKKKQLIGAKIKLKIPLARCTRLEKRSNEI
jgi:hypothetical protein